MSFDMKAYFSTTQMRSSQRSSYALSSLSPFLLPHLALLVPFLDLLRLSVR
jgi:hypothetical protein